MEWTRQARNVLLTVFSACITTDIRLYYSVGFTHSADMTYTAALVARWAEAELTCGFLVACLPYLPNLVKHVKNNLQSSRSSEVPETWAEQQCENPNIVGGKSKVSTAQTERDDSSGGKLANDLARGKESIV